MILGAPYSLTDRASFKIIEPLVMLYPRIWLPIEVRCITQPMIGKLLDELVTEEHSPAARNQLKTVEDIDGTDTASVDRALGNVEDKLSLIRRVQRTFTCRGERYILGSDTKYDHHDFIGDAQDTYNRRLGRDVLRLVQQSNFFNDTAPRSQILPRKT